MEEYRNLIVPFDTGKNPGETERGEQRRDWNERKRKGRRTVWRRHDLRRKGPGVFLRTYFNARTLSRIGSADICLPNSEILLSHEPRCFRSPIHPAIQISSYLSPRETQDGKTTRSYRVAFRKAFLDPGKAAKKHAGARYSISGLFSQFLL